MTLYAVKPLWPPMCRSPGVGLKGFFRRSDEILAIPRSGGRGFAHKPYVAIRATKPDPPFV